MLTAGPTADGFRVELWVPRVIRVLLADDQRVVREGLATLLGLLAGRRGGRHRRRRRGGARAGGRAPARRGADGPAHAPLRRRRGHPPLRARAPRAWVLLLTTYADDRSVLDALRAGARGYLTKDAGAEEIRRALAPVARGRPRSTRPCSTISSRRSAPRGARGRDPGSRTG